MTLHDITIPIQGKVTVKGINADSIETARDKAITILKSKNSIYSIVEESNDGLCIYVRMAPGAILDAIASLPEDEVEDEVEDEIESPDDF